MNISNEVNTYFNQLTKAGIQKCINDESELYQVIKERKSKRMYDALMESCNNGISEYNLYKIDTQKLLANLYGNEDSDFVIVNMINHNDNSVLLSKSTFTFSRKKMKKKFIL